MLLYLTLRESFDHLLHKFYHRALPATTTHFEPVLWHFLAFLLLRRDEEEKETGELRQLTVVGKRLKGFEQSQILF